MNIDQMFRIGNEVTSQYIGGSIIGRTLDYFFPEAESVNSKNIFKVGIETIGQLFLSGVLSVQFHSFSAGRGLNPNTDPTRGVVFVVALFSSQPNLKMKMKDLVDYFEAILVGVNFVSTKGPISTKNQPLPQTQNNTPNFTHETPIQDDSNADQRFLNQFDLEGGSQIPHNF